MWLPGESALLQSASGPLVVWLHPWRYKGVGRENLHLKTSVKTLPKQDKRSVSSFKTNSRETTWKGISIPNSSWEDCFKIHRVLVTYRTMFLLSAQDKNPREIYIFWVLCSWRNCRISKIIKTHPLTFASIMRTGNETSCWLPPVLIPKVLCAAPPFIVRSFWRFLLLEVHDSPSEETEASHKGEDLLSALWKAATRRGPIKTAGKLLQRVTLVSFIGDWFLITHLNVVCSRLQL